MPDLIPDFSRSAAQIAREDAARQAERLQRRMSWATLATAVFTAAAAIASAFASVFAYESVGFTRKADRRDAIHREIAIQPDLTAYLSNTDRVWAIENTGVGPAVIQYMVLGVEKTSPAGNTRFECIDSRESGEFWNRNQKIYMDEIRKELKISYSDYNKDNNLNGNDINIVIEGSIFDLSETISATKTRNLVRVNAQFKPDKFSVTLKTGDSEAIETRLSERFAAVMRTRQFKICYCSLSRAFCGLIGDTAKFKTCARHPEARRADDARIAADWEAARLCEARAADARGKAADALSGRD